MPRRAHGTEGSFVLLLERGEWGVAASWILIAASAMLGEYCAGDVLSGSDLFQDADAALAWASLQARNLGAERILAIDETSGARPSLSMRSIQRPERKVPPTRH